MKKYPKIKKKLVAPTSEKQQIEDKTANRISFGCRSK